MDDEDKREKPKREGSEERVDDDDDDESEENKNLRDLILEQLASLEQSDVSDDGSYKVRLSCILEDDESESSGALKRAETDNKPNEEGILENRSIGLRSTGDADEAETGGKSGSETVRVTNLDDSVVADDASQEKTEERHKESEESDEIDVEPNAYQLKKLKSSDDLHKKPFFVRRREPSSDSSDLDISITNSTNGTIGDVKVEKVAVDEEKGGDKTLTELAEDKTKHSIQNPSTDERVQESERSEIKIEEDVGEPKTKNRIEVLDNETISSIFAKVSKAYLEKTKGPVKWEENERVDRPITPMRSERSRSRERPEDQISIQDAHIRGTSPKVYNPPVPPETYLWEELKRLRERGGYPWTYLDKPPFDEASWKKYMEHVYEPINPPSSSSEKNLSKEELTNMAAPSLKVPSIPDSDKQFVETELVKKDLGVVEESKKLSSEEMDKAYEEQEPLHESLGTAVQSVDQTTTVTAMPTTVTATPTTGPTSLKKTLSTPKFDGTKLKDTTSKFFKDIPVKCATFEKTRRQQIRAQAHEIQEKLRNQAGRIRTRLNEKKEEGPVRKAKEVEGGAIRFKLPEVHAPKIWPLPTKFNLTDKPKLHFQESAKLHLPHSSKFHLPERKNFNLAGKIRLPEKKKLSFARQSTLTHAQKTQIAFTRKSQISPAG